MKDAIGYLRVSTQEQAEAAWGSLLNGSTSSSSESGRNSLSPPGIRTFRQAPARTRSHCDPVLLPRLRRHAPRSAPSLSLGWTACRETCISLPD